MARHTTKSSLMKILFNLEVTSQCEQVVCFRCMSDQWGFILFVSPVEYPFGFRCMSDQWGFIYYGNKDAASLRFRCMSDQWGFIQNHSSPKQCFSFRCMSDQWGFILKLYITVLKRASVGQANNILSEYLKTRNYFKSQSSFSGKHHPK